MVVEKIGLTDVDLNVIKRGPSQARQTNVAVEMDDLVSSIRVQGLMEPIHLVEIEKDKIYELIDGQRRFQAYSILRQSDPARFSKIPSFIYKNTMQDWEKKTLSLHANLLQAPMGRLDKINAVTRVYNHFGNMRDTAAATGFSEPTIRSYVKISRLPADLKSAIEKEGLSLQAALDAADMYGYDSHDPDAGKIHVMLESARVMQKLAGKQKKRVIEIKRNNPDMSVSDIIKSMASKPRITREIKVSVESDTYDRIDTYKDREKIASIPIAAVNLIEDGLKANEV